VTSFDTPQPQDKVVILRRVPVFAACTEEQLRLIADRTRLVEYKKGEVVYQQGDAANAFYIVSSGRLRAFSTLGGQDKTFTVFHNGDSFGEISLLTGETHSATVQALNDTLILQLQKKDFEEAINRIPSLVLHLSRLLSKRLRARERGGEFSDVTIVGIHSAAAGVGRTCFAVALAALLRRETGRSVVIVDFGGAEGKQQWLSGAAGPRQTGRETLLGIASEGRSDPLVSDHPLGFSVLFARELLAEAAGEQAIAPLLSALANRFQYILLDLPIELDPVVLKALIQSDLVCLITDPQDDHLIRTTALIHQLKASVGPLEQRMKVVLNLRERLDAKPDLAAVAQQLGQPVACTLPYVASPSGELSTAELTTLLDDPKAPYTAAVRYVARDLGGLLVGLALGSGAALGLAHIGVLKVIEREKVPIDLVAGSSIGALVGGLWAAGFSAEDLERMAMRFKNPWDIRKLFVLDLGIPILSVLVGLVAGILVGWPAGFWTGLLFGFMVTVAFALVFGPLVGGPIQGARLMAQLEQDFAGKTFEETRVPLKIVAANPMAREEVIFDSGRLADAVRASVSIPGIFKPVVRMGKVCLDGGVVNPIPVSVLKRFGAHHVIAVNVFPTAAELAAHRQEAQRRRAERDAALASRRLPVRLFWRIRQELVRSVSPFIFDVIMRSMQSMEHQIAEVACREADFVLRPTVPGSHWLEFFNPEKFIRRGEEATLQYLQELKRVTGMRRVDNAGPGQ
jgi:NTE family protein